MQSFLAWCASGPLLIANDPRVEETPAENESSSGRRELTFGQLLSAARRDGKTVERLRPLAGARVRMNGFMAEQKNLSRGGFYLVPGPMPGDESKPRHAALPPEAIWVAVRSAAGQEVTYVSGLLQVRGVLEVGHFTLENGHTAALRIVLDGLPPPPVRPASESLGGWAGYAATETETAPAVRRSA